MFERLLKGMLRLARRGQFFQREHLLPLQLRDPLLIGRNNRVVARLNDPVEQLLDLLLKTTDALLQRLRRLSALLEAHVPGVLEHHPHETEQGLRRLQTLENALELAFKLLALDGLPIALAALRRTEIIRVLLVLALRPAGRQRLAAIVAQDESPQREVRADVLARGSLRCARQPLLDGLERLEADKAFMVALPQTDAPIRGLDVPGIDDAGQHLVDALVANLTIRQVFREVWLPLKEALDLDLRLEAP
nr:hypothetical protein [Paracoccus sp. Z118]